MGGLSSSNLPKLSNEELRVLCKESGLPTTGQKPHLVARLRAVVERYRARLGLSPAQPSRLLGDGVGAQHSLSLQGRSRS